MSDELCKATIAQWESAGRNTMQAANAIGVSRTTFQSRLREGLARASSAAWFSLSGIWIIWTEGRTMAGDSRSLDDLNPIVAAKAKDFIRRCKDRGIDLLVTCTLRSMATQAALYAQGRTAPGKKVTNAKPGQSFHNFGVALDVVPLRFGKPVWNTSGADGALWQTVAECGEAAGLEWAGRWKSFREMAHFQYTGGHPLSWFQAGGHL